MAGLTVLLALSPRPVRAQYPGSYAISYSGGNFTSQTDNNPPGQSAYYLDSGGFYGYEYYTEAQSGHSATSTCSGTIKVTLTWNNGGNPNNLPPQSINLLETCDTLWSGPAAGNGAPAATGSLYNPLGGQATPNNPGPGAVWNDSSLRQITNPGLTYSYTISPSANASWDNTGVYYGDAVAGVLYQAQKFSAGLTGDSTADTANWDGTHPRFFSGTDCMAKGTAAAVSGYVTSEALTINGTTVKSYSDTGTHNTSVPLSVSFDSTHFPDGSTITIQLKVTDSASNTYAATITGPVVNNAFLMYNSTNSVDDSNGVNQAKASADAVHGALAGSNIHPSAEDGQDNDAGLEGQWDNAANQYTVFFAADHADQALNGNTYVLGDCLAIPDPDDTADWLTDANISTAVQQAAASPSQPPYNFVYLHSCNSGSGNTFATDFGIPSSLGDDRGGIGFTSNSQYNQEHNLTPPGYSEDGELAITQQNTNYTQALWQALLSGQDVTAAIDSAFKQTGGAQEWYAPTQQGQQGVIGQNNTAIATVLTGSDSMTVAGAVFDGSPGQWFQ